MSRLRYCMRKHAERFGLVDIPFIEACNEGTSPGIPPSKEDRRRNIEEELKSRNVELEIIKKYDEKESDGIPGGHFASGNDDDFETGTPGRIWFSIRYHETANEMLILSLYKGRNFKKSEKVYDYGVDVLIKIYLHPDARILKPIKSIIRGLPDPVFADRVVFEVPKEFFELKTLHMVFSLVDNSTTAADNTPVVIGDISCALKDLKLEEVVYKDLQSSSFDLLTGLPPHACLMDFDLHYSDRPQHRLITIDNLRVLMTLSEPLPDLLSPIEVVLYDEDQLIGVKTDSFNNPTRNTGDGHVIEFVFEDDIKILRMKCNINRTSVTINLRIKSQNQDLQGMLVLGGNKFAEYGTGIEHWKRMIDHPTCTISQSHHIILARLPPINAIPCNMELSLRYSNESNRLYVRVYYLRVLMKLSELVQESEISVELYKAGILKEKLIGRWTQKKTNSETSSSCGDGFEFAYDDFVFDQQYRFPLKYSRLNKTSVTINVRVRLQNEGIQGNIEGKLVLGRRPWVAEHATGIEHWENMLDNMRLSKLQTHNILLTRL